MSIFDHRGRRRPILTRIAASAAAVAFLAAPLAAALPSPEQIAFKVFRDGAPLGHHRVSFRHEADALHVEIDIELEVKFAFLTVFRYSHRNYEVWRDGRLAAIDTQTDDDGETFWLRGRATEAGLQVEGSSGTFVAPSDVMPTSYWNPDTVNRTRLLDTQRGRLIDVAIAPAQIERITVAGQQVDARRYEVTGELDLDLWYTADGDWAKTSFEARGAEVVYARERGQSGGSDSESSTRLQ